MCLLSNWCHPKKTAGSLRHVRRYQVFSLDGARQSTKMVTCTS